MKRPIFQLPSKQLRDALEELDAANQRTLTISTALNALTSEYQVLLNALVNGSLTLADFQRFGSMVVYVGQLSEGLQRELASLKQLGKV